MKRRIFLDMDNVVADFSITTNEEEAIAKMWEPGYFQNLVPTCSDIDAVVNILQMLDYDVCILSHGVATEYCRMEKLIWISINANSVPMGNRIVIPKTISKSNYCKPGDILVDDFGKNLREWEMAGGIAIRFDSTKRKSDYNAVYHLAELPIRVLEIERRLGR